MLSFLSLYAESHIIDKILDPKHHTYKNPGGKNQDAQKPKNVEKEHKKRAEMLVQNITDLFKGHISHKLKDIEEILSSNVTDVEKEEKINDMLMAASEQAIKDMFAPKI